MFLHEFMHHLVEPIIALTCSSLQRLFQRQLPLYFLCYSILNAANRFIFIVMFLLNLFLISANSSGAMPFGTLLSVVFLWFLIDAPLTIVGGLLGKKHGVRQGNCVITLIRCNHYYLL